MEKWAFGPTDSSEDPKMKNILALLSICLIVCVSLVTASCSNEETSGETNEASLDWLYSMSASNGAFSQSGDGESKLVLTMSSTDIDILRFSERPNRLAEEVEIQDLAWFWSPLGTFSSDPPNATIQFLLDDVSYQSVVTIEDLSYDDDAETVTAQLNILDTTGIFDYSSSAVINDMSLFIDGVEDDATTKVIPNYLDLFKKAKWGSYDGRAELAVVIWNLTMTPPEHPPVGGKYSTVCQVGAQRCPVAGLQYQPTCPAAIKIHSADFSHGGWTNYQFAESTLLPGEAVVGTMRSDGSKMAGGDTRIQFSMNIECINYFIHGEEIAFDFNWDPFEDHSSCHWDNMMSDEGAYVVCEDSYSFGQGSSFWDPVAPVPEVLHLATYDRNGNSGGMVWVDALHNYFSALKDVYGLPSWEKWTADLVSDVTSIIIAEAQDITGVIVIGVFMNPTEYCSGCSLLPFAQSVPGEDYFDCSPSNPWRPPAPESFWQRVENDFANDLRDLLDLF